MGKAYVLRAGDTPAMVAVKFMGDASRVGQLIDLNPQFTRVVRKDRFGRPIRAFDASSWREGVTVRLPVSWVSPVIGQVGSGGDVDLWGSCGKDSDCSGDLVCNSDGQCDQPGPSTANGGSCDSNTPCAAGFTCINGWCQQYNPADPGTYNGPSCSSDAIVRKVQAALGVSVDGAWGCKSQAALEKSGMEYRYLAGTCDGQPPDPAKTSKCAAGQVCKDGVCGGAPVVVSPPPPKSCGKGGAKCSADGDCCGGLSCQNGACATPVAVTPAKKSSSLGWILALIAGGAGVVGVAYASSKKKGGAKQNPAGRMMNKQEAVRDFKKYILPAVVARYGRNDKPAIHEAWNDYTDSLQKDGLITASQYHNWVGPF